MSDQKQSLTNPIELPRVSILGTRVTAGSLTAVVEHFSRLVDERCSCYVSSANAFSTTLAYDDSAYRDILNGAVIVTADGMPIVWVLRLLGYKCERVHNDDLVLACCDRFQQWRHFLVGGKVKQPEAVAMELERRFPGIQIVGTHPTPVRPVPNDENEVILEKIRAANPSVVWVALGTPAQDHWMHQVSDDLGVPLVACGSLFDLLAGHTKPTPEWMKRSGLQWLFRLVLEPRRLITRYSYYNTRFTLAVVKQLLQGIGR